MTPRKIVLPKMAISELNTDGLNSENSNDYTGIANDGEVEVPDHEDNASVEQGAEESKPRAFVPPDGTDDSDTEPFQPEATSSQNATAAQSEAGFSASGGFSTLGDRESGFPDGESDFNQMDINESGSPENDADFQTNESGFGASEPSATPDSDRPESTHTKESPNNESGIEMCDLPIEPPSELSLPHPDLPLRPRSPSGCTPDTDATDVTDGNNHDSDSGIGRDAGLSEQESMDKSHSSDTTPNMFETQLSDTVSTEGSEPHNTPGREAEITPGPDTPGLEENGLVQVAGGLHNMEDTSCQTTDDLIKTSANQQAGSDHVTILSNQDGERRPLHNYVRSMESGSVHDDNEDAEIEGKTQIYWKIYCHTCQGHGVSSESHPPNTQATIDQHFSP